MKRAECYFVLRDRALDWLLQEENPSARYLALTQLLELPSNALEVHAARNDIPSVSPALHILEAQYPVSSNGTQVHGGYWIRPEAMYSPRHRATMWQVLFLAQLGTPLIPPLQRACEHILKRGRCPSTGRFVAGHASRVRLNCLDGALLWAFQRLSYTDDPRVIQAREATAREAVKHAFACTNNQYLPCAWGAVKMLHAFLDLDTKRRTADINAAIECGIELLLSKPLLEAAYPTSSSVSPLWFALAFPLTCQADLLEAMTVLALAGYAKHPYVQECLPWLLNKQLTEGKWPLERTPSKMWASFGELGCANKWVTLRALYALKLLHQAGMS